MSKYNLSEIALAVVTGVTSWFFLISFIYLSFFLSTLGVDVGKVHLTLVDYTLSIKSFWAFFLGSILAIFLFLVFEAIRDLLFRIWIRDIILHVFCVIIFTLGTVILQSRDDALIAFTSGHFVEINDEKYKLLRTFEKGFLIESNNVLKFIYEDGSKIIDLGKSNFLEEKAKDSSEKKQP